MTAVDTSRPSTARAHVALGSKGFVTILSLCMAVTALAIDTILPAYGEIRGALGLADDATEVTGLVTFYMMGSSIGLLPAGLLSDRFGRRAVMWGGLSLYMAGAIASIFAPSLTVMFIARFVWGLGGAGPRVAAMAMVRDGFSGEKMARQMSFIMAVFMLVPAVAPSLAALALAIGPWHSVFWICAAAAGIVAVLVGRLPETLPPPQRRPLAVKSVAASFRMVLFAPGMIFYLISLTALFGAFMSYLASSELIMDQTFGHPEWFPVFFGWIGIVLLLAMVVNGRFVERLGLARLLRYAFTGNLTAVLALLTMALLTDGTPPFWLFVVMFSVVVFFQQMLTPNINAVAMRPLAGVAGTGAALLGMVSGTVGAVIGESINRRFDGTVTPLAMGFTAASLIALTSWRVAERAQRRHAPAL